jgi:competence protein ComEC
MQKPIISLTLAYIAGLVLGHGFLYFPWSAAVLAVLLILTAGILTRLDKLSFRRFLLIILPGILGMAAYIYSAAWLPAEHYTRVTTPDKSMHEATGEIVSPLDRDPGRTAFVMDLRELDGAPVEGFVRVSVREELASVGHGDLIRVSGRLRNPGNFQNPGGFDYAAYLAQRGVYSTMSAKNGDALRVISRGHGVFRTIQDWRERIRQSFLASTNGHGSAILQAMVLGEEGGLTEELRDRFMAAGVTHIISISGSHLGMVAVLCFGLLRGLLFLMPEGLYLRLTLRADPKKIAAWLTLPLIVFYTLLAGGQTATVRSLIMITAGLMALILDREHALMHSLALAALAILFVSPQALFDISFQLSFLSVLVIGAVVSLRHELPMRSETRLQKTRNSALVLVVISLAASLATAPLVAYYFNQVSLAGLVSNLVVVPFAGMVVVPLGLFSGILSLFTNNLPLARLNQLAADIFIDVVGFFSRLPFAEFHPQQPNILWLACYAAFFLSLFPYLRVRLLARVKPFEMPSRVSRLPKMTLVAAGAFLALSPALSFFPGQQSMISFPDVGQGDCAFIELASGKTVLIDGGGTRDNRFDIGRRVVAPFLWGRGVRSVDLVILSHPHPDHMNGLLFVLRKFTVGELWTHGLDRDLPGYEQLENIVKERHIRQRIVSAEDRPIMLGEAVLRVLHPAKEFTARQRQAYAAENSRSLVVRIADRGRTYLFTGDIGIDAEQYLLDAGRNVKCDVLKVPHHGSKSSSSESFISLTGPAVAVVSVGRENPYRHPADEVMDRYEQAGAEICRTDRDGAVFIKADKDRLDVARWSELMLRRIRPMKPEEWKAIEKQNWQRIGKRMKV